MKMADNAELNHIPTDDMEDIGTVMSNFDREIDEEVAAQLCEKPGLVMAGYPGWDFYARVFYLDTKYHAEVWRYRTPVDTISADTLQEIMHDVSEEYGYD